MKKKATTRKNRHRIDETEEECLGPFIPLPLPWGEKWVSGSGCMESA